MTTKSTHKIFVTTGSSNHTSKNRSDNDLYTTDPKALERLLEVKKLHSSVWECACGLGHLSEVLRANGYKVLSSDIKNYGYIHQTDEIDFLSYSQKGTKANLDIVTNPPYLKALEFCAKALEIINDGYYVVMFLRLQFLEGKKRKAFFDKFPPKEIYVFSDRINCLDPFGENPKSSAICYAWFIWEKGFQGNPSIYWL